MGKLHDTINAMSAAEILSRLNLQRANDGKSYVCPACDNGLGDARHGHGDGIKPRDVGGRVRWKCFKCGRDFSNFDLAAVTLGREPEHDKASAAREVGELFGISDDRDFSFSRGETSRRPARAENRSVNVVDEKKSASTSEPKNYAKLYEYCREHYSLKKFVDEQGGKWRGLTFDTLSRAGCLYHGKFMLSKGNEKPCVIIPYDDYHYLARAVDGSKDKSKGGSNAGLYEPMAIKTGRGANFLFEGEINALSAVQVLKSDKDYFGCVATGSASNWHKVVPELNKRFGKVERKPAFIVIFDDDGTNNSVSKEHARSLKIALNAAGYPAEISFFEENTDANDLLVHGDNVLHGRLIDALDYCGVEIDKQRKNFAEQREAMAATAERERQAELNQSDSGTFSFAEYFGGGQFDAYTSRFERYSSRKTGFENLDDGQLIFAPGLYVVGALPAVGKTTFCWQLVSNLADAGEPVVYLTFEMSRHELFAKTVAREMFKRYRDVKEIMRLNLTNSNLRRGAGRAVAEVNQLIQEFGQSKTPLDVIEPSNKTIAEIIADELKPRATNASDKSLVVVVDYLQIMPSNADSAKAAVDDAVLRLKNFQRDFNATLIVISSFNRQNYNQSVSFESFKESGAIEFGCDVLLGLEYDIGTGESIKDAIAKASRDNVRNVKLVCLKNRNGAPFDASFKYHAAFDYFEPVKEKKSRVIDEG